ncbi:PREDICTED: meiosis-specific coiled-coil domain-containing protein MEIOC [Nanorana parkeri]|uniref:meiosis-specific coiled-coil domain-containing protein MEIOC n=1 Tax=Nanorana parkeri TaxID=125878 RepID=UPI000854500E|nr:PREDICTED: meiosis-specific coiled-coil domain-containing protein MEIOC [Nanorana parkeri]
MAAAMEQSAAYRSNSWCWNGADTGSKLVNLYTNSSIPKPSSSHNAYKPQDEETIDVLRGYESSVPSPSNNYSTNWAYSSLLCSPWSVYSDEIKPGTAAQLNTKSRIQSEKNEYGSEADLYGLVSNILEEQDKAQPYFADGKCPPTLKSSWTLGLNRLSDHQGLPSDIKHAEDLAILQQDFRGLESLPSTETHKAKDLFHELPGVEQDDRWPHFCLMDNPSSYNINHRNGFKESSLANNCLSPASMVPETPKDPFQNREPLVSSLNKYSFYTEPDRYDMLNNNNRTKLSKNPVPGFQEGRSLANVTSELTGLDAEVYAKLIQVKQSCHKPNSFMADQNYAFSKATNHISDRSFMPEYDHKSDYGKKTPGIEGGHLQKLTQRYDVQSAHVMKPTNILCTANSDWPLWMNSQPHSNSYPTLPGRQVNSFSSASQKGPVLGSHYSSTCSPLGPDSNFQSHHSKSPAYPSLDYGYGSDQTNDRFGSTKGECALQVVSEKRLELFNGLHENVLNCSNSHENTGKRIYQDKRMQYHAEQLHPEYLARIYQGILCNRPNCKNQRLESGDNKAMSSSKATYPLTACSLNALMMDNMANNLSSLSATHFQSCLCDKTEASNLPLMDSYTYKELGQMYPQISDLLHGDNSLQNMAPMLSSQKSTKLRSRSAAQLHLRLEECYQQCRALEQERRKTECVFVQAYPGKTLPNVNNICIPKLPANPSRVDRLIVDQLHEQARVVTLVGKMERYCSAPFHANISTVLDLYLETIHLVQARRKEEMVNTSGRQKHKRTHPQDDRDVCALANSIRELTVATRKVRTALWCALQMVLPFHPGKAHDKG